MEVFLEFSSILLITLIVTAVVRKLKQPLVVGYILAGIIVGPSALKLLTATSEAELFSKIGIVFLLFIVGLHLNPKVIKEVGKVSLATGLGQVIFTSAIGFVIALALGLDRTSALYVAIALTFSSTIIILKLLSDKHDLHKLYAKIAIGFLLVQDVVASLILMGVAVVSGTDSGQTSLWVTGGLIILKGVGLLAFLFALHKYLLPKTLRNIAKNQELMFLFTLTWATTMAGLFYLLGFSVEIGALVAGVVLSTSPYSEEMSSRLKPLRDFFIIIFFVLLGAQFSLANLGGLLIPALILSAFVLIGNPIIVILLMNTLGYTRKTGFLAGLTVAQISEFSLILATLGFQVGHLDQEVLTLITLVGLITIVTSTYFILYADWLYPRLSFFLQKLELMTPKRNNSSNSSLKPRAVLFGFDRVGERFVQAFTKHTDQYLVVDFNPASIERLDELGYPHQFGDASDVEFLGDLPLDDTRLAVSTIPDLEDSLILVRSLKQRKPRMNLVVLAHNQTDALALYEAGASYVIMPHFLGAQHAAKLIQKFGFSNQLYTEERLKHQDELDG